MTTTTSDIEVPQTKAPAFEPKSTSLPGPAPDGSRCVYRFSNGKRCRRPGLESHSGLCSYHFGLSAAAVVPPAPSDFSDLSPDLLPELSQCSSLVDIRKFLSRLLVLVTQGRVSPRRASVLSYITYQLLHSPVPPKEKPALSPSPIKSSLLRLARDVAEQTDRKGTSNDY